MANNRDEEPDLSRPVDLEVIVPAFNEQERIVDTLTALVDQLRQLPLSAHLRVIDNGSCDRTADLVDWVTQWHRGVAVTIEGCSRRGKGRAVARGMLTSAAPAVGFCDADLATPAEAIAEAVHYLEDGWPIVIGSRRVSGASFVVGQPLARRAGGAAFRLLTRRLAGGVKDTQCGFKFFDGDLARMLFRDVSLDGFAFDVEVLARARVMRVPVKELPVDWTDRDGSTFHPVVHGAEVARDLWRLHRTYRDLAAEHEHHVVGVPG